MHTGFGDQRCGPAEEEETQSEDEEGLEDDRIRDTGLGLSRVELGASSSYTPGPRLRPSQLRGGGVGKHQLEEARVAPSGPGEWPFAGAEGQGEPGFAYRDKILEEYLEESEFLLAGR